MKPSRLILAGLLALSLTACGTLSPAAPTKLLPPAELLLDCPVPARPSERTNAALAGWLIQYDDALAACNADKASLRSWANGS